MSSPSYRDLHTGDALGIPHDDNRKGVDLNLTAQSSDASSQHKTSASLPSVNRSAKGFKGEARPRRTYACGPCKRYKMKCNLETPCKSCATSKRIQDCLENPANPPSEEEKSKIEKRRRRNSRKKETESTRIQTVRTKPETINEISPGAVSASSKNESLSSESSPIAAKTLSPSGKEFVFNLNVPLATDFVAPPPCNVRRVQNFKFMKDYAISCQQQTALLSHETAVEIFSLLENVSYDVCTRHFQKYANLSGDGVQYLVDIKDYFNVAHNLIVKCRQIAQHETAVFDGFSMRGLSLSALVFAYKEISEGAYTRALRWIKVSEDAIAALGEPESLEDLLHHGTWLSMIKMPLALGARFTHIRSLCEQYVSKISSCSDFMQYICLGDEGDSAPVLASDLDVLTQKFSDMHLRQGNHDEFIAVARVWVLLRFFEVEINALSSNGTLQQKYMSRHVTIQPTKLLLEMAFGVDFNVLNDTSPFFQNTLSISGRFFGRFDRISSPSRLIHSYLMLYNELNCMSEPLMLKLYSELPNMDPVACIEKYCETISILVMKYYLSVRWLTITKVEKNHFPSLRFAHYVSNLLVANRLMQVLDARLASFPDTDRDPHYLDENTQVNVFLVAFSNAPNVLVLQIHYNLVYQSLFLAVLSQFVHDPRCSTHIDLSYVFAQIHHSLLFARIKIDSISTLRTIPAVAQLRTFVAFFHDFALRPVCVSAEKSEFLASLPPLMTQTVFDALSLMCFGSTERLDDYVTRLWDFFAYLAMFPEPVRVSDRLYIGTEFFKRFETSIEPFNFSVQVVNDYMTDVVNPA